jgi:hypothetical protein
MCGGALFVLIEVAFRYTPATIEKPSALTLLYVGPGCEARGSPDIDAKQQEHMGGQKVFGAHCMRRMREEHRDENLVHRWRCDTVVAGHVRPIDSFCPTPTRQTWAWFGAGLRYEQ